MQKGCHGNTTPAGDAGNRCKLQEESYFSARPRESYRVPRSAPRSWVWAQTYGHTNVFESAARSSGSYKESQLDVEASILCYLWLLGPDQVGKILPGQDFSPKACRLRFIARRRARFPFESFFSSAMSTACSRLPVMSFMGLMQVFQHGLRFWGTSCGCGRLSCGSGEQAAALVLVEPLMSYLSVNAGSPKR